MDRLKACSTSSATPDVKLPPAARNFAVWCNVFIDRRNHADFPSLVHSVVLLLAAGAVGSGSVSVGVAILITVPDPGICRRRSARTVEGHHSASSASLARTQPRLVRATFWTLIIYSTKKP